MYPKVDSLKGQMRCSNFFAILRLRKEHKKQYQEKEMT